MNEVDIVRHSFHLFQKAEELGITVSVLDAYPIYPNEIILMKDKKEIYRTTMVHSATAFLAGIELYSKTNKGKDGNNERDQVGTTPAD